MNHNLQKYWRFKNFDIMTVISYLLLFAGAWLMMFPFIWMISSSFKPTHEMFDQNWTFGQKNLKSSKITIAFYSNKILPCSF